MIKKKLLQRCVLIVIAMMFVASSTTLAFSASGSEIEEDLEESPLPAEDVAFEDLFEVSFDPDIMDDDEIEPGQDFTVTVTGKELPDGSRVQIDGNKYRNPEFDRDVPAMINVTNVLWDGSPWYAEYDDTVWRRNGTMDKFYERVNPYQVKLHIWSEVPDDEGYQFPPGCHVSFHLYVGNKTREEGVWVNRYFESEKYHYNVTGAFPHRPIDTPEEELFEKNMKLDYNPHEPSTRDDVKVNITSKSDININRATLQLEAVYPNGTKDYYQYFFTPANENETWPEHSAVATIKEEDGWHDIPETNIIFNVEARDPHGNKITSNNYSYNVEDVASWKYPGQFDPNIELNTNPDVSSYNTTVPRNAGVEVTIESRDDNIPIENAYLFYNISNTWHGVPYKGQWQMEQEGPVKWSYEIPAQDPEVQVEFFIRAWDLNGNMIESDKYLYTIEEEPEEPEERGQSIFYVTVYDAELDRHLPDVRVEMGNYSWETTTYTDLSGRCYPNITGDRYTPQYLTINESYWIEVYYPHQIGNETREMVHIEYDLKHPASRNETEVVYEEGNLVVTRENDTLKFEYNTPPEPPEFASIHPGHDIRTLFYVLVVVGMAAPIGWKLYKITEEGKQERSLVR
ncbi:MAG: hypothetical protein ACOCTR_03240 [Candidatus Natronoplasma sp.]